ncbi:MAG: RNB domain-containing ribonuclease [Paraprevotella sp.]|nr:RNB domain-containing ribonuclease [Paraprevotella sp.]
MGKTGKKGGKRLKKKELAKMLMDLFQNNPAEVYDIKRIFRDLGLTTHPAKLLCMDLLEDLAMDDYIKETDNLHFRLNSTGQVFEAIFNRKANGKNTVTPVDGGEPVLVAERNALHAMNGDKVKVTLLARRKHHVREAQVVEILSRADKTFVGRLEVRRDFAFLVTEDRTLANDIFIPQRALKGGKNGDKAVVKITEWPKEAKNPIGKVIDILGKSGENTTEMHAILAEYGLPYVYPAEVEAEAEKIDPGITPEEIARREDMRGVTTFTIDPRDAKDFDDAISIRNTEDGFWEVGVHIADVSHYVKEGSIIDKEAVKRATSVYLVDRTIPMLPERLCNFICSLRPDEDKLTYSVIFKLDDHAVVKDWHLAHTVIKSDRRFTYEEVQAVLEKNHEASPEDYNLPGDHAADPNFSGPNVIPADQFADKLIVLNRLAKQLRSRRFEHGAINFDRCEVRFDIDEKGKPVGVYFKVAKDANKLVEEFMLLANRTVAESVGKRPKNGKPKTFPYRIHDLPDPDKLVNLSEFIVKFGYKLKPTGTKEEVSKGLNKLLTDIQGKKEQNLIETVSLRAMMKARYSTHNIGHYGLAFDYYTHFTSPIRRYPDVMVHRLLTRYAEGGRSASQDKYEELCEHCSTMEQLAASAERASIKYKQVEFMSDKLGQVFEGTVSGVTEFGLYVEINENKCEGMVPLRDLNDDYYEFDERNYSLWGRKFHNRYSLGDAVKIKVARANLEKKQLDFALVKE